MPRLSANTTHRKAFANSGAGEAIADMLVMAHVTLGALFSFFTHAFDPRTWASALTEADRQAALLHFGRALEIEPLCYEAMLGQGILHSSQDILISAYRPGTELNAV